MAEKMQGFQRTKGLYPNLRYSTAGDDNVRLSHKKWEGFTAPVDHPIWKKMSPPNDWGCRCNLVATDQDVSKNLELFNPSIKEEFANNPVSSGKIFPKINYKKSLNNETVQKTIKRGNELIDKFKHKTSYKPNVIKEYESGGKIISSNLVDVNSNDYQRVLQCCEYFAKLGHETEILPRFNAPLKNESYKKIFKNIKHTDFWGKCPDFRVGTTFYEHEGFESTNKAIQKMLKRGVKQSTYLIIDDDNSTNNFIKKVINFRIKQGQIINEVWKLKQNKQLELIYKNENPIK